MGAPSSLEDLMRITEKEFDKYSKIWEFEDYNDNSPGAGFADLFFMECQPQVGDTVVDLGCGKGNGGLKLAKNDLKVSYIDLVKVNEELSPFKQQSLWQPIYGHWKYGYCCDVMEHIPEQLTGLVLHNILVACEITFFNIAFLQDSCGSLIDDKLHLTVRPFLWWKSTIEEIGELIHGRDLISSGVFIVKSSYHQEAEHVAT